MSLQFSRITIDFIDGTKIEETVTRTLVTEGVLFLWYQSGQVMSEKHVGSYPLVNIKKWRCTEV